MGLIDGGGRFLVLILGRARWLTLAILAGTACAATFAVGAGPAAARHDNRAVTGHADRRRVANWSRPKRVIESQPAASRRQLRRLEHRSVAPPAISRELVRLRTATSDTFLAKNGKRVVHVYATPINFRVGEHDWQPINDSLVARGGKVVNHADAYRVSIPSRLGHAPVTVSEHAARIGLSLLGAHGAGVVHGSRDTFAKALPGVSVVYRASSLGVKDDLVLASARSRSRFVYRLSLSRGLRPKSLGRGGLEILNRAGRVVYSVAPPFMYDARDTATAVGHVSMALRHRGGHWLVIMRADRHWLLAHGRRWPVTIDPTVSMGPTIDCKLLSAAPTTSLCGTSTDTVRAGSTAAHDLMYFNLAGVIPQDSEVLNATLGEYLSTWSGSGAVPISVYGLTQSFTGAATWNTYDGTHAWVTPGGDYDGTAQSTVSVPPTAGWYYWSPTTLVQQWVDGTKTNYGLMLREADGYSNELHFNGVGATSNQPYLSIEYWPRVSAPMVSQQLDDRMSLGANVANGDLTLHANDLQITGTGLNETVTRTYNNLLTTAQNSGNGWWTGSAPDEHLEIEANGSVIYFAPDGEAFPFFVNTTGGYTTPTGIDAALVLNTSGTYTLTLNDSGEVDQFSSTGVLTSQADRNGDTISYSGMTGSTGTITDTEGRVSTVAFASGTHFITGVTDSTSRSVGYGYNTAGDMTSYTDASGNHTYYAYDSSNNLTQITDPNGNITKLAYNAARQITSIIRVTNVSAGTGPTTSFAYYTPSTAPVSCGGVPSGTVELGETVVTSPSGAQATYCYDTHDHVFAMIDAAGHRSEITYAASGIPTSSTDPTGATSTASVDSCNRLSGTQQPTTVSGTTAFGQTATYPSACGSPIDYQPTSVSDSLGNTTTYGFNSYGDVTSITDALAASGPYQNTSQDQITLGYSSTKPGELTSSTDPNGNLTSYGYDAYGNLTSITPPSPRHAETFSYDGLSRIASSTDGNGNLTSYSYDPMDRTLTATYSGGVTVSSTYDADGNLVYESDPSGSQTFAYNALNEMIVQTTPSGQTIDYTYNHDGTLASMTDASGTTTYTYNGQGELTQITDPTSASTTFTYDADGNRTSIAYPNGVTVTYTYDAANRVRSLVAKNSSGTTIASEAYTYVEHALDSALIQTTTDQSGNITTYTYDPLGRLVQAKTVSAGGTTLADYQYTYDGAGNRLTQVINGVSTSYSYNSADQLTGAGSRSLTYDANGNETNNGSLALTVNSRNQTTAVGSTSLSFFGGGQNSQTSNGGTSLIDSQLGIDAITTGTSTSYVTADTNGNPLGERTTSGNTYFITDPNGTVLDVTNSSGAIVRANTYDPYGSITASTGSGVSDFGYDGAYANQLSGLYHFGARLYDPSTGRWTQPDPAAASLLDDPTQANPYGYAGDDPINAVDATGTSVHTWYINPATASAWGSILLASAAAYHLVSRALPLEVQLAVRASGNLCRRC